MLNPIQREHELVCPGCGAVIDNIHETPTHVEMKAMIPPNLNIFLLGSAIENNIKFKFNKDSQQLQYEKSLKRMMDITKEYVLPDRIAYATMSEVKKNKRGLYSFQMQIKLLLSILAKDENYIYFPKMRAIKARYENVSGI